MDIRIDTPNSDDMNDPTDEEYIYAPFEETDHREGYEEEEASGMDAEGAPTEGTGTETRLEDDESVPVIETEGTLEYFEPTDDPDSFSDIPSIDDEGEGAATESSRDEEEETAQEDEVVSKVEYDALMDRYQRLISDWDNYRRRSSEEMAQAKANANRNMAEALIPTFDHFGFALSHSSQMEDNPAAQEVAKGFEAIYRAMVDSLSREGLVVIDPAPGSPFDMNENQAVEQVPDTGMEPESIVKVVQVGYKFNDYVIRPAMVAVAS